MMTSKVAAIKWNVKERRVRFLCNEGRIPGAVLVDGIWQIPEDAIKPEKIKYSNVIKPLRIHLEKNDGFYGPYGGRDMPDSFASTFIELKREFNKNSHKRSFKRKIRAAFDEIGCKMTPLLNATKFMSLFPGNLLYVKREDLNVTESIYINQIIYFCVLAKEINKDVIYSECEDVNYAKSLIFAVNHFKLKLRLFIGESDYYKYKTFIKNLKIDDGDITIISSGNGDIYNATSECFKSYINDKNNSLYIFHDAIGVDPIPYIVDRSVLEVSDFVGSQFRYELDRDPKIVVAPIQIASNALAIFNPYLKKNIKLVGVENELCIASSEKISAIHGVFTKNAVDSHDLYHHFPCMNYPSLNPKICELIDSKRLAVETITEEEAISACKLFYETEGVLPCIEDGYTLAYVIKLCKKSKIARILICFTGSSTKDREYFSTKNINSVL